MVESEKKVEMPPEDKKRMAKASKETIHSGHFMVSEIDDNEVVVEVQSPSVVHESDCDQESTSNEYQFPEVEKETKREVYTFGPRSSQSISIEVSLTQLFQCMSIAYSAKLTSPRWKTFKGLKLKLKDKIRLNNIIWRAWHIQFISRRKPSVCQFVSPLDADAQNKGAEMMVVDEFSWKPKYSTINSEFKKRHLFYHDKYRAKQRKSSQDSTVMAMNLDPGWSLYRPNSTMVSSPFTFDDDSFPDFGDALLNSFFQGQPYDLPNPREIAARAGIADFIQPGLTQLQPSLDDFMDTFEPLSDFLSSKLPPLIEESEQTFPEALSFLNPQQNNNVSSIPEQQKGIGLSALSQDVASCETPYPLVTQTLPVQQQNTSTKLIANSIQCPDININPQGTMQNINTLPLNIVTEQPTVQNSVTPILNSAIVPPDFPMEVSLPTSLQTNQRNQHSSLSSFEPLIIPCTTKSQSLVQTRQLNSPQTVNDLPQNCEQPSSFYVTGQLNSTHTVSQVPQTLVSQKRTQQIDKHSNRTASVQQITLPTSNKINSTVAHFQTPVHIASSVPSQLPITMQSHISLNVAKPSTMIAVKSESPLHKVCVTGNSMLTSSVGTKVVASNEQIRRHSYTGVTVNDAAANRRATAPRSRNSFSSITNMPIPHQNSEGKFAVPQLPVKQRVRSRSVSSPQSSAMRTSPPQPSSSVSLNNVNVSPPLAPQLPTNNDTLSLPSKNSFMPTSVTLGNPTQNVLPQNAMLAQLLTGNSLASHLDRQPSFSSIAPTTTVVTSTLPSTVTIIANTLPTLASTTQTFVISPVAIATVASAPSLPRSLFIETVGNHGGSQAGIQERMSSVSPSLISSSSDPNALSSNKPFRPKSDEERVQYKEHRRVCHINAEQKRRCNIKIQSLRSQRTEDIHCVLRKGYYYKNISNGFEALRHLLPSLSQNPNAKVSKAAMLQKGAEYIRTLKVERQQQQEEAEILRQQRDNLNEAISMYQNQLPATGAPIACQRTNRMKEMFDDYVRTQTLRNWKFWIFSLFLEPLLETFSNTVSTNNVEELCKSVLDWVDQHCSLVELRPGVLNSLTRLSTTTNILTEPARLPEEATRAVTKKEGGVQ